MITRVAQQRHRSLSATLTTNRLIEKQTENINIKSFDIHDLNIASTKKNC